MRRSGLIALALTLACGRVSFDELPVAGPKDAGVEGDAATVSLSFSGEAEIADTGIEAFFDTRNCGACSDFNGGGGETGLLRVDLSSVPPGTTVRSARLEIWLGSLFTPGGDTSVYVVREAWDEGEADYIEGVANWNERQPGVSWTAAGAGEGSRDADPFATFVPTTLDEPIKIDVPIEVAQSWVDAPATNFGVAFIGQGYPGDGGDHPHFVSSESPDAASRGPKLTVELEAE